MLKQLKYLSFIDCGQLKFTLLKNTGQERKKATDAMLAVYSKDTAEEKKTCTKYYITHLDLTTRARNRRQVGFIAVLSF